MMLETKRLVLRPWEESDAAECYRYAKDPLVGPIAGWPAHTSIEDSLHAIHTVLSAPGTFAVIWKETGLAIGSIGLKFGDATDLTEQKDECEIGFWLGVPYWGQGIMTEAVKEMDDAGCGSCAYERNESRTCKLHNKDRVGKRRLLTILPKPPESRANRLFQRPAG